MIVAYGVEPQSARGLKFRRMHHTWDALWQYCVLKHHDIVSRFDVDDCDDCTLIVDSDSAHELSARLFDELRSGVVDDYVASRNIYYGSIVPEPCAVCNSTGVRVDEVGQDLMMDTLELSLEQTLMYGRTHGWCNECEGAGEVGVWEKSRRLAVSDVSKFAVFLATSGGCKIYK